MHVYFQMDTGTICQNPVDDGTPTVRLGEKGCMRIHATNNNHTSQLKLNPAIMFTSNAGKTLQDQTPKY